MKLIKIGLGGFLIFVLGTPAIAVESLWGSITAYTSTKSDKTVPISDSAPIKVHTTASTCSAYVTNSSGTGVPLAANTFYEIKVPANISNIVFKCSSSVGTTVTVIK
jgi:hypothetical protein